MEPKFARLVSDRVNSAHSAIDEHNLSLRLQNMRGQRHQTELFLYDAETFFLCGDVSLERDKNRPATEFTRREGTPYVVNGKEIVGTHIEHFKSLNLQAKSQLVVRLHFAVHSFINLYVWDPKKEEEVLGWKIKQINPSTKQSHFLTLDKILCEIEAKDLRHTKRLARYDSKVDKNIRGFSRQQGLLISDFDGFMPRNNPIVDFTEDAWNESLDWETMEMTFECDFIGDIIIRYN